MRGYAYSATGDLLTVADTKRGATKYRHDAAHRLMEEIPPGGPARRFQHDAAGNLLEQPGLKDVVIEEANRLKEANGERYSYNNRGDISERQGPNGPQLATNTTRWTCSSAAMSTASRGRPVMTVFVAASKRPGAVKRPPTTGTISGWRRRCARTGHAAFTSTQMMSRWRRSFSSSMRASTRNLIRESATTSSRTRSARQSALRTMREGFAGARKSIPTAWPMLIKATRSRCRCAFRDTTSTRRPAFITTDFGISAPSWDDISSRTLPAYSEASMFTLTCMIP